MLRKLASKVGIICRLSKLLPIKLLNTIYRTIFHPYLDYCITVWGSCASSYIMPLQRLQNRAASAITGIHDWNVHSTEIIKMLNWMSVREIYEYLSRVLMHKCIFKTSPSYLTSRFKYVNEVHPRHTRTAVNNLLYPPRPKLSLFKGSFTYSGSFL